VDIECTGKSPPDKHLRQVYSGGIASEGIKKRTLQITDLQDSNLVTH